MTDLFVPRAMNVMLPLSGRMLKLWRGIHAIPDELADHEMANRLGLKPTHEMTDAEWVSLGMKKPVAPEPVELEEVLEVTEPVDDVRSGHQVLTVVKGQPPKAE